MTKQKSLKSKVRTRMAKTGERYTAARRNLVSAPPGSPSPPAGKGPAGGVSPAVEMPVPDEAVVRATGHGYEHWFALLDAWDGTAHTHTEIARWLSAEHGVPGWWTQAITVGYERARGRRVVGQQASGDWSIGATKTVNVPVETLLAAFDQPRVREHWLPGVDMRARNEATLKGARYDWEDGSRVVVWFEGLGEAKSRVAIQHEKLPSAEDAEEMKAWWRARLTELKALLEPGKL